MKCLNTTGLKLAATVWIGAAALVSSGPVFAKNEVKARHPKVIVIAFDGMDAQLTEKMMDAGELPVLDAMRKKNGYRRLATSNPPQTPVAFASFINGADPGSHGIFDFVLRDPSKQCVPYYGAAETVEGVGYVEFRGHHLPLNFWPFNHSLDQTLLKREGTPFWHYLDQAGIHSDFYDLPSDYPPSKSEFGNHRCMAGMGVPDLLGTYGTYQHYGEDDPVRTREESGGMRTMLFFEEGAAKAELTGPQDSFLAQPVPIKIPFTVYRDVDSMSAVIEIQDHTVILNEGQWGSWLQVDFPLSLPGPLPDKHISGICRFYLQEVAPNFRLYVTPINMDPSNPAATITEPPEFSTEVASELGLYYTAGFQEDHKALSNGIFTDEEYAAQAQMVLDERLHMLDYAKEHYKDGLLFFYFASTDLQAHMFWWDDPARPHPTRSKEQSEKYFNCVKDLYREADAIVAGLLSEYGDEATLIVMSDHGFANFSRQFNVNTWLRDNGYIQPADCTGLMDGTVDWSKTRAYAIGMNGLYINLKGRERDGIVEPGEEADQLMTELIEKLKQVRDEDGRPVLRNVYLSSEVYHGPAMARAPDFVLGYYRDYRTSWASTLGDMNEGILTDNKEAWAADHCIDPLEVPGVLFSNRPIDKEDPALIDLAPTILAEFGLEKPVQMTGNNIF
ncbi:MAG: alkaline phosphatase family protein [Kiritimatiellaeota bacterium]|nr:alkaline phosphatase family protein [Kiritimatiellota bacterium]